ncbi:MULTISPECIES: hypothetical protein [unclassified Bradyrhizobium]|uniref:hypothetical protein n=1 Tax=unclassified Bradyrhizobium TaxID=2631580 RepID=UPI001FFBF6B2|nr:MULTISPECIES: hypothetical protein [unclassified Bradyrhizobium]MCK1269249.1 hypothetical protein [Bradyrhizobium sp. 84]MCK1374955.1 hypothetical protein [Bradyrhizobium sp. 49]MCK1417824.1 hypothetical protein [Bradyrhizobium sp. CW4]MCK1427358.1 hypothetical protein [Bradyrhizobium sp. 87]
MQPPFDFVHLDPSSDPPEPYQEAFELFGELWAKLHGFKARCGHDHLLLSLIHHLEHQFVVTGLVLAIQLDLLNDR